MGQKLNALVDFLSEFFAARKGLLILVGIVSVLCNALLAILPGYRLVRDEQFIITSGNCDCFDRSSTGLGIVILYRFEV